MNSSDELRRSDEALGAPEGVVEIGAVTLELRREATVDYGVAAAPLEEVQHERRRIFGDESHVRIATKEKKKKKRRRRVAGILYLKESQETSSLFFFFFLQRERERRACEKLTDMADSETCAATYSERKWGR